MAREQVGPDMLRRWSPPPSDGGCGHWVLMAVARVTVHAQWMSVAGEPQTEYYFKFVFLP